ncbi:MAG: formylglycine-generating enzyme family protein [Halanaerobiales bacterium]|nr:formylglycine-generating enzyme family protein [Halanaerobiales bacterium]
MCKKSLSILLFLFLILFFTISLCSADNYEPQMVTVSAGSIPLGEEILIINKDFEIGKYEVTNAEYIMFLNKSGISPEELFDYDYNKHVLIDITDSDCLIGHNGSEYYFRGGDISPEADENCPVFEVSWYGAVLYCNWLSEQLDLTPAYNLETWKLKDSPENLEGYRLPTEDEWGYAAHGGQNYNLTTYAGSENLNLVGWYYENAGGNVHPVGKKMPNELNIYDMSGNVKEWTNTSIDEHSRMRGGSWAFNDYYCEVDYYGTYAEKIVTNHLIGFRVARTK